MVCNPAGNYLIEENNPVVFSKFIKPNIVDGNDVIINPSDIYYLKEYPHAVGQQFYYNNGLFYLGIEIYTTHSYWKDKAGFVGSGVAIFDNKFDIIKIIRNDRIETERAYVYNDSLFVSSKLSISEDYNQECFWIDKYINYIE